MACAIDRQEFLAFARIADARDVIFLIFIHHFQFLTRPWVHQRQHHLVSVQVCGGIHQTIVGRELHEINHLLEVRRQNGAKLLLFSVAVENLRVHAVNDGRHGPQFPLVVRHPSLPVSRILRQ